MQASSAKAEKNYYLAVVSTAEYLGLTFEALQQLVTGRVTLFSTAVVPFQEVLQMLQSDLPSAVELVSQSKAL